MFTLTVKVISVKSNSRFISLRPIGFVSELRCQLWLWHQIMDKLQQKQRFKVYEVGKSVRTVVTGRQLLVVNTALAILAVSYSLII